MLKEEILTPEMQQSLHAEIHARPPTLLTAPQMIKHMVFWASHEQKQLAREYLNDLLEQDGQPGLDASAVFAQCQIGPVQLRWELHTEFVSWTFMRVPQASEIQAISAHPWPDPLTDLPPGWLQNLPGTLLTGVKLWVLPLQQVQPDACLAHLFGDRYVTGSWVISQSTQLYADLKVRADACTHMLILTPAADTRSNYALRLGRLVQRVLEIETYRMTALLGLPAARQSASWLSQAEDELAAVARDVSHTDNAGEPALLDRLTRLAARLEEMYARTHSRFSASAAYHHLVLQRLDDIVEQRMEDMQTLRAFLSRRLAPAMATCRSVDARQASLSERIARIDNLLRTRINMAQKRGSRELLASMNRRQYLQLRLQSTVEGLSVAAISYYVVGLVAYLARGARQIGWPWSVETSVALATPVVIFGVWFSLRAMHHRIMGREEESDDTQE